MEALPCCLATGLLSGIGYLALRAIQNSRTGDTKMVCTRCETVSKPRKEPKGSLGVEIALWLFFLLPGMVYSVWRLTNQQRRCPSCDSEELVPVDSPRGQKILEARH